MWGPCDNNICRLGFGAQLPLCMDPPYFVSFPEDGTDIQVTYKQSNILGFEFETTIGSYDQALDQLLRQKL